MIERSLAKIRDLLSQAKLEESRFVLFLFHKGQLSPREEKEGGRLFLQDLPEEHASKILKHWDHSLQVYQAWALGHREQGSFPEAQKEARPSEPTEAKDEKSVAPPAPPALPATENGEKKKAGELRPYPTKTLSSCSPLLTRRFDPSQVKLRPGPTNESKTHAIAFPYTDRRAYQERLDEVVGPDGWEVSYRSLGSLTAVVCRLTILGHTKEEVGEAASGNPNAWTSASAQAFKRACASFGIGRYLGSLPRLWAEYDSQKKCFKNPAQVVAQMHENKR